MKNNALKLFESEIGKKIYSDFKRAISDFSMLENIKSGLVVGFSGGPDSVMLLCALYKLSKELSINLNLLAVHVNHKIRIGEAERDEEFSRKFCLSMGVEFTAREIDVPKLSETLSLGIEEAARNARYSIFDEIILSRNDISSIAVAHNSTDNLETVIFNILRGAGTHGLRGINPKRDNIIRPLIYSSKEDILSALKEASIPYVIDSTNLKSDYTRNYIRLNIIPHLSNIKNNPEASVTRMCKNVRMDDDYLESCSEDFFVSRYSEKGILLSDLKALHPAVLSRVILLLAKKYDIKSLESIHIEKIRELIYSKNTDFSVSIPGKLNIISKNGYVYPASFENNEPEGFDIELKLGINSIPNSSEVLILSEQPFDKSFTNVYKISIKQSVDFDIINGGLKARSKLDGDSYRYGNMTHKLKKIFNDKKIPLEYRSKIPVIYDKSGILWVPGFPLRDGAFSKNLKKLYIALAKDACEDKNYCAVNTKFDDI